MNTYKLNISQEEVKSYKALGAVAYGFMLLFVLAGIIVILSAARRNGEWISYFHALYLFASALIIYAQLKGKWIYKKYIQVDAEKIVYTSSPLLGTTKIAWKEVQEVIGGNTNIIFKIRGGRTHRFDLPPISIPQIRELKEVLKEHCLKYGCNFSGLGRIA